MNYEPVVYCEDCGTRHKASENCAWYSYGQITFRRKHIVWLLNRVDILGSGRWPKPPPTGYNDGGGHSSLKAEGEQEKPAIVLAEITIRLEQAYTDDQDDGYLVIAHYLNGVSLEGLARTGGRITVPEVQYRMRHAITWAGSGPCRRWQPCGLCERIKTCLHKDWHRPINYTDFSRGGGFHLERFT